MKKLLIIIVFPIVFALSSCATNDDIYLERWSNKTTFHANIGGAMPGEEVEFFAVLKYSCKDNDCMLETTYNESGNVTINHGTNLYTYEAEEEQWYLNSSSVRLMSTFELQLSDFAYDKDDGVFYAKETSIGEEYTSIKLYVNNENQVVEERDLAISSSGQIIHIAYFDFNNEHDIELPEDYIDLTN